MDPENDDDDLSGLGDPTNSVTGDYSFLNHEKDLLFEKTKTQENEIMALRLKVESYEKEKKDAARNSEDTFTKEEKTALEWEIGVLRGKVALLERNNKIFSNEERTELKQELERTKRRFQNMNQQLSGIRNSMEYDHINHVERALENFVKKVKSLEKENNDLRKKKAAASTTEEGIETQKMIDEQEEIIKDQEILIEELQHRIKSMKTRDQKVVRSGSYPPTAFVPAIEVREVFEPAESPPKTYRSSWSSPRRSRSRLSSIRSKRGRNKDAESDPPSSSLGSDSDARAVREMCGKMREDIEEAKQKLKDMGDALESPQHSSPMHFPLKVYSSPTVESAEIYRSEYDGKSSATISPRRSARSRPGRESSVSMTVDEMLQFEPRSVVKGEDVKSVTEEHITPRPAARLASARFSLPLEQSPRSSRFRELQQGRVKAETFAEPKSKFNTGRVEKSNGNFLHLLSRYEFLRFRNLDHRYLELEQECMREEYENLLKHRSYQERASPRYETKTVPGRMAYYDTTAYSPLGYPAYAGNAGKYNYPSSYALHDTSPFRKQEQQQEMASMSSSFASTYSLPESDDLRAAAYRIYVAKREYIPPKEDIPKDRRVFSKIPLCIGDVVTSLGAPERREDGITYQLVEVSDKIGLVPLSYLQLAEQVYDTERIRKVSRGYLTNTLRRIPDLYKRLHDRRRVMQCGV